MRPVCSLWVQARLGPGPLSGCGGQEPSTCGAQVLLPARPLSPTRPTSVSAKPVLVFLGHPGSLPTRLTRLPVTF